MGVRSKRLWGPTPVSTIQVALYTAPAGETSLLKTLCLVNNNTLGNTILFRLNGSAAGNNLLARTIAGSGSDTLTELFIVLQPGDVLNAIATASACIVSGFGAELEGFAD